MLSRIRELMTPAPVAHWSACRSPLPGSRVVASDLGRARRHTWAPPLVIGARRKSLQLAEPSGTFDRNLVVLESARLQSPDGVIELNDGSLLAEPAWHPDSVDKFLRRPPAARRRRQRGPWFSCLLRFGTNYYHWVCDVLPRFHRVLERLPADTRFVVPNDMTPWQWDSLAALGIARDRCAALPPDESWVFDELYYAAPVAMCGDQEPESLAWLRERITANAPVAPRRRLYVTRRLARRRIINEDRHWQLFADAGFTLVEAERFTFGEQAALFAAAACVVGPHGAGMANVVWAPPAIRIAEFFSPAFATQRCIWTLANARGDRYLAAMAADAPGDGRDLEWDAELVREVIGWATGDGAPDRER